MNPNFIVEITEPSEEDVLMKVWRAVNGEKANPDVCDTYHLKRMPGVPAEQICAEVAPHLFNT